MSLKLMERKNIDNESIIDNQIRDFDRINKAVKSIYKYRKKCPGFDSVKIIRKWRDAQ